MKTKKGFTVLYAVLVSSLILSLGMGIVAITLKEVQLSGSGRDSQFAFYAADSGAECAFYWDLKGNYFATSTVPAELNPSDMKCNEQTLTSNSWSDTVGNGDPTSATSTFHMYMVTKPGGTGDSSQSCAIVNVNKYLNSADKIITVIDSRGYNTCDDNPRRLERGYRIEY